MTLSVGRAAVLLLVVATFAGCAGSGRDRGKSAALIDAEGAQALGYTLNWATDLPLGRRGGIAHAKVLGDVLIVVESPRQIVTALSMRNGAPIWRRTLDDPKNELFAPTRFEDRILINTSTRTWQLRARDGDILRVTDLDRVVTTGPLVAEDLVVYGGIDGTLFADLLETGITRWEYQLTDHFLAPLIASETNVFAADSRGAYAMLQPANGALLWRGRTFGPIVCEPAADKAQVYVASRDNNLYALERATGRDVWTYHTQSDLTLPPRAFDSAVLLPIPNKGLVALDAATGAVRWEMDARVLAVAARGGDVVLAGAQHLVLADLATGRVRGEARTQPLATVRSGPDNSLILISRTGRILRLNPTR